MNAEETKKTKKKIGRGFSKSRKAAAIACILFAFLIGFVITPFVSRYSSGMVTVVEAAKVIPEGTKITTSMLKTVKMSRKGLPNGTAHSIAAAVGEYASVDITSGDILTSSKFEKSGNEYNPQSGKMLMSISISQMADSLSGKLEKGDIVSVFVSTTTNGTTTAQNPDELKYVEVVSATAKSGNDVNNNTAASKTEDTLPATVTLLVTQKQAQILTEYENSAVHLALVSRGDTSKANKLLSTEDNFLNTGSFSTNKTGGTSSQSTSSSAVQ